MRVDLNKVASWVKESILSCEDCISRNDIALVCGWHENVSTATRIVEITSGILVREELDNN
jgi:hypothetical protein